MPDAASGAILSDFFEEIAVGIEEKRELRSDLIHIEPTPKAPIHVFDAVAQCECQFLDSRGARLADVVATDRNGIKFWSVLRRKFDGVNHQPHRRLGRVNVFLLRDVLLKNVVLKSAGNFLPVCALLFRDREVHRPNYRCGRVDRHGRAYVRDRNLIEQDFHVGERTDRNAAFADLAFGKRVVRVVTHQRGKIECDGETRLTLREQITESLVGVCRGSESCKLTHRPEAAAVHRRVNAACVWRGAG